MISTKLKLTLGLALALGLCFAAGDSSTLRADKPKVDDKAATKKKPAGDMIRGHVKSVDVDKNTVTVSVPVGKNKDTEDKTVTLGKGSKIMLEDATMKTESLLEGKLTELPAGTYVTVLLDAENKNVIWLSARGPTLHGSIKSTDPVRKAITVESKGADGLMEDTLALVDGAKVLLNDGLAKGDADQEATLDKIKEGTPAWVQLTVDRKRVLFVRPEGQHIQGKVTAIDTGNNTITVNIKENGQLIDKGYTLGKGALIDNGVAAGSPVYVRLSVFDENIVVKVNLREE